MKWFRSVLCVGLSWLVFSALALRAQEAVVISEMVANNDGAFLDEDGLASDWIEIYNSGSTAVDLAGWHLTDDPGDLAKWTFPSTNLPPKAFLVVFASDKQQNQAGLPLHTGFALNSAGGYLGLVHPDGLTVASEFAPAYPRQHSGFSYGVPQHVTVTPLVPTNAPLRYLVPSDGALGRDWIAPEFNDSNWRPGTNGVGYELTVPGWAVRVYKASVLVETLDTAETVIATPNLQSAVYLENAPYVNYFNSGGEGHYDNNRMVPGFGSTDVEDYIIEAVGYVTIPTAGQWTFGVSSDDGFKLTVGGFLDICDCLRGPGDTLQTFNFTAPGEYPIRLVFFERGGGSEVEVFAVKGAVGGWTSDFRLVGDTARSGLAVRSKPVGGVGGAGGGGGYADQIRTDLQAAMLNKSATAYLRLPFQVADPSALHALTLSVRYDDGFVAYLNGVEVARRNAPETLDWTSTATAPHSGGSLEPVYLTDHMDLVRAGPNVLAIQALNESTTSAGFLLKVQLDDVNVEAGGTGYRYFDTVTPGAANSGTPGADFVRDVRLSVPHGFYDTPQLVAVICDTPDAQIYYTLDGSAPTPTSGLLYSGPIGISSTTTLRAAGFKDGQYPSVVATATYVFPLDVIRQPENVPPGPGWPAARGRGTGSQTFDYGMDQTVVNNATISQTIVGDLKSIPTFSVVMDLGDFGDPVTGFYSNPYGDTISWERPCSLELINPNGSGDFQVDCGIRTRGGYSRSTDNPKHGLRFFFRSEYGPGSLKFPVAARQGGAASYEKFDLRTFQNYSWSFDGDSRFTGMRDTFSRDTQLAMGQPGTRGDYYHLYINGAYWGVYNIEERAEASFGASYFGGSSTNYDTIKVSPDDGYVIYATDGDMEAWTRLWMQATNGFTSNENYFKVQGRNPDGTPNPAYENLIDVDNLIDYMLVILYGGNLDAPISNFLGNTAPNNFFAVRDRTGAHGGFRFMAHDSEHTLLDASANRIGPFPAGNPSTGGLARSNPQYFWQQMWGNTEFRIRVADRAQKHFFNGGALVATNAIARLNVRSNMIFQAVNAESARWGNAARSPALSRSDWLTTLKFIYSSFVPSRGNTVLSQLKGKNLFPTISAPGINQYGGRVTGGFEVVLSNPNASGTVYYTLDDTDVRSVGGAVSPSAVAYTPGAPIRVYFQTRVRARVLSGTTWSAQIEPFFYPQQDYSKFLVTELMYNPPAMGAIAGDNLEFLELRNASTNPVDVSGAHFSSGIKFTFPGGSVIQPGQFVVLARDPVSLRAKYPGVTVFGTYTGKLSNKGDTLTLVDALGQRILSFTYGNGGQWPATADGMGFSLVPRGADAGAGAGLNEPSSWRASAQIGGSPGLEDPVPPTGAVVINEVLTNPTVGQSDAVELFNPADAPVDISHWSLTDKAGEPLKYRFAQGTVLQPGEYRVFTEADFNAVPGAAGNFALSSLGEEVYLFGATAGDALTGYSHGFSFDGSAPGETFGRVVNSVGAERFEPQLAATLGATNAGPRVGPVVISRILYHPIDLGGASNTLDEFIELVNITDQPVAMNGPDGGGGPGWRLGGSVAMEIPPGTLLPPGGTILLSKIDALNSQAVAEFRARFSATAPIVGPMTGTLGDDLGRVEILRPGTAAGGITPYIRVERVDYESGQPWPTNANGTGRALQRITASAYANDPTNWVAAGDLVVWTPPRSVSTRPTSNVTFSVYATADAPLVYQWKHGGTNLVNDSRYGGVTSSNLLVVNAQAAIAGDYQVTISDGSRAVTAGPANLRMLINPTVLVPPLSQTVMQGDSITLKVQVADTATLPLTYVWQIQTNGYQTNVSTSFSDTLLIANARTNMNIRVLIKNDSIPSGVASANAVITVLADTDGDLMPDVWETANGLNAKDPRDAQLDTDGDGVSNLDEFRAGTNPKDAASVFRLVAFAASQGGVGLQAPFVSNRTYSVQFRPGFGSGAWLTLTNLSAQATNGVWRMVDPVPPASGGATTTRFYRAVTPAQP